MTNYAELIQKSGLTIYDDLPADRPDLYIPTDKLKAILQKGLKGINYGDVAIRTRSKLVNQDICKILGYPVPKSFTKTKPRFCGQNFDKYVQKANNLQVWNDELDASRRYVIIKQNSDGSLGRVKVITGLDLQHFDRTGTLTQKYQATLKPSIHKEAELISTSDTENLVDLIPCNRLQDNYSVSPTAKPQTGDLKSIKYIYETLKELIGVEFKDAGADQERVRGDILHRLVCKRLGYSSFADNGQFPDILNQLLEIKLQTSPTIDLGLVQPSSTTPIESLTIGGTTIRHCDVRYALFYGEISNGIVKIVNIYLTNGRDFFSRFPRFEGKIINKKLQHPLPKDFFIT